MDKEIEELLRNCRLDPIEISFNRCGAERWTARGCVLDNKTEQHWFKGAGQTLSEALKAMRAADDASED
jgi:hypothetical protein